MFANTAQADREHAAAGRMFVAEERMKVRSLCDAVILHSFRGETMEAAVRLQELRELTAAAGARRSA